MGIAEEPHHFCINMPLRLLLHVQAMHVVVHMLRAARGRGEVPVKGPAAVGALMEVEVARCWGLLGRGGHPVTWRRALLLFALG